MGLRGWLGRAAVAALFHFLAFPGILGAQGAPRFPGSEILLQDGDVLLHFSPLPLDAFNRLFALPKGPYSHASVYVVRADRSGRVVDYSSVGMGEREAGPLLAQAYRLALLRPVTAVPAGRLAGAVASMRARVAAGDIKFDFRLHWSGPDEPDDGRYYCTEFISRLFRTAGLVPPFVPGDDPDDGFWRDWVKRHMDLDYASVVSPNAPLASPAFRLLAEYRRDDAELKRREVELDTLFGKVQAYVREDGLVPAPPTPGSRLLLAMADNGFLGEELVGGLPSRSRPILLTVQEFIVRVQERVERAVWTHGGEHWSDEELAAFTARTADVFKDRYFRKPEGP